MTMVNMVQRKPTPDTTRGLVFIDSNIPMYVTGRDHPLRAAAVLTQPVLP
jgi:hypothetical protein